jgi:putative aldouronate transport system permease protein
MQNVKRHKSKKQRMKAFDFLNYLALALFAFLCFFPVLYVFLLSVSSRADYLNANLLVLPLHPHIESYKLIFYHLNVGRSFLISLIVTAGFTLFAMILTCLGAYAFTKKNVPGLKVIFTFIIVTMFFSGGLIPFYITVRSVVGLNNLAALIIPFGINTFNLIIMRNFFNQVPESLIESCKIDGASEFRILLQFVVPLSKAGIATVSLFYLVGKWDDWFWPSIFLTSRYDLYPLALQIRTVLNNEVVGQPPGGIGVDMAKIFDQGRNSAIIVVSMIPILAVYPFLQKYFTKGVMLGSIKA